MGLPEMAARRTCDPDCSPNHNKGSAHMKVAFIGLGVMGFPMAGHLAKAGHEVSVFNRSPEKARRWVETHGGKAGATVSEATRDCELVALCVGNDDDVRQVVPLILEAIAPGGIIVDHTTTSAKVAVEMAALAAQGGRFFVDAPVSGGQAGAENGKLSVMAGGDQAAFDRAQPVLLAYSKAVMRIGDAGAGQLAKMVNQICIAGVVQGLAEAVHFSKQAGIDPALVYQAISQGAAQSWQMDNRWATMVDGKFDFGFAVDWMRKDLGLVLDAARTNGARLEMTALVDQFYAEVQSMGGRRWDTSSLAARLERPK
ncbi:MAG: oxidoreductase [Caulobacter sp.]|nr:oxidoreductase [Caulobacter sp.]